MKSITMNATLPMAGMLYGQEIMMVNVLKLRRKGMMARKCKCLTVLKRMTNRIKKLISAQAK